jgi:hypothetical protein
MAKRAKPIKKKKPKNWKKKADDTWSLILRLRYQQCEICGRRGKMTKSGYCIGGLNAHHLIGRGTLLFRHDLRNGLCLCIYCHKWNPAHSPHCGMVEAIRGYMEWMEDNKPEQWAWYEKHKHERRTPKLTYEESYHVLKEYLNRGDFPTYTE